jgi:hypothetical protein
MMKKYAEHKSKEVVPMANISNCRKFDAKMRIIYNVIKNLKTCTLKKP